MTDHMVDLEAALDAVTDERDAARRLLLRLARAADAAASHEMEDTSADVLRPLADMLGCSVWGLGDALRGVCQSAESARPARRPDPTDGATLRRMALAVADHLDAGHPPGAALARAIGMSEPLTDREMVGAIRGLCGVRRG